VLRVAGVRVTPPAPVPDALAAFRAEAEASDVLLVTGSHHTVAQLPEKSDTSN
jgi:hypothetical protein